MTFTQEQRAAVEQTGTVPVTIDGIECVILRADVYHRVRQIFDFDDGDVHPEETYPAVLEAWDADGSPQDDEDYKA